MQQLQFAEFISFFVFKKQAPMSPSVRQICEQRFVSALKDLLSSKEMKLIELHNIVQQAKVISYMYVHTQRYYSHQWCNVAGWKHYT